VVFKWKQWARPEALVKLSAGLTAVGFLPSVVTLLQVGRKLRLKGELIQSYTSSAHTPMLPLLPWALFTCSMSFFLFSFQVHEKTILVPLMPLTLLLCSAPLDSAMFGWAALVNNIAVFSMSPLLRRDGLSLQYVAMLVLWNRLIGYNPLRLPPKSFIRMLSVTVYMAAMAVHVAETFISPPQRYPDVFPVLNVLISTPVFGLAWLWSIKSGIQVGWALSGLGAAATSRVGSENEGQLSTRDRKWSESTISERPPASRAASLGYTGARRRPKLSTPTEESGEGL